MRIKIFFLIIMITSITNIYSNEVTNLLNDTENIWSTGLRPLSFGNEYYIISQGSLIPTQNETDFAIHGSGFFVLLDTIKNEIVMTRNGKFSFNTDGYLINHDNMYVLKAESDLVRKEYVFMKQSDIKTKRVKEPIIGGMLPLFPYEKKNNQFLLIMPENVESITIIDSEYVIFFGYRISENSSIYNNTLETMPINIKDLLEKIMVDIKFFDRDEEKESKISLYNILQTRINEAKGRNEYDFECLLEIERLFMQTGEKLIEIQ